MILISSTMLALSVSSLASMPDKAIRQEPTYEAPIPTRTLASPATFYPPHSDYGSDHDSDGYYEQLMLVVYINVTIPGSYHIGAELYDSSMSLIEYHRIGTWYGSGIGSMSFSYNCYLIHTNGVDGPYLVLLTLYDDYWNVLDEGNHTTAPYVFDQFEKPPAWIEPPVSDNGYDSDGNGLYNFLVLNVTLNVTVASTYFVGANLLDSNESFITSFYDFPWLNPGLHLFSILLDGGAILANGIDGPYEYYTFLNDGGGLIRFDFDQNFTSPYAFDQFESPPVTLTVHDPIYINGNAGFSNASGVIWGSGTQADPYIIDGWEINASANTGILISDTDAHFRVSNCYIHDGADVYDGVHLLSCINANISSCEIDSNKFGMNIADSNSIELYVNHMNQNTVDIYIDDCDHLLIRENTMYSGIVFFNGQIDDLASHTVDSSNTVGGKPIYYLKDQSGVTAPTDIGQAFIFNCSDIAIRGINLNHAAVGIEICFARNVTVRGSTILNSSFIGILTYSVEDCDFGGINISDGVVGLWLISSQRISVHDSTVSNHTGGGFFGGVSGGISLYDASYCTMYNNLIRDNGGYGIDVMGSNNRIWNNIFIGNNGAGDAYNPTHVQARDIVGTGNLWNGTDGHGNFWSDWTTPDVAPADGIVDEPYAIDGGVGAMDNYPLTTPPEPIPEFGAMPLVVIVLLVAIVLTIGARRRKAQ